MLLNSNEKEKKKEEVVVNRIIVICEMTYLYSIPQNLDLRTS